jgi:DNA processing protein
MLPLQNWKATRIQQANSSPSIATGKAAETARVTNKNSWGPNTLIKQGRSGFATGEDVREDLPAEVKLALAPTAWSESRSSCSASLFPDEGLAPHEKRILSPLKADEATHIDELVG